MWQQIINMLKTTYLRGTENIIPSEKKWVFSSVHNNAFNYNSSYLFLYVKEHCPDIRPYYVINDNNHRKELEKKYGTGYFIDANTMEGIRKILSCKVWLTSTSPPLYGTKFRDQYIIINLWHGIPLKRIGMEQENLSWFVKKYYKYLYADNYTAVITTSEKLKPVMSRSFLVEMDRIKVYGQPRNDQLFKVQDVKNVICRVYGDVPYFEKVILYAPTFRDNEETRIFPFKEFEDSQTRKETVRKLQDFLENHKLLLCIRMHLYDTTNNYWLREMDYSENRIRLLNEDRIEDIMEILNIFDLLITDYSSIFIDYLLTGKPILFLPYDKDKYLKERGLNFEYDDITPGPKPETFNEFLNFIYDMLYNHDDYIQERMKVNNFFNEIKKPCCGEICDYIRNYIMGTDS